MGTVKSTWWNGRGRNFRGVHENVFYIFKKYLQFLGFDLLFIINIFFFSRHVRPALRQSLWPLPVFPIDIQQQSPPQPPPFAAALQQLILSLSPLVVHCGCHGCHGGCGCTLQQHAAAAARAGHGQEGVFRALLNSYLCVVMKEKGNFKSRTDDCYRISSWWK